MRSDDPDFERKAADVIGLYLNPPQQAAVFAVDEKTAIQALDSTSKWSFWFPMLSRICSLSMASQLS
jgi:hypothetical protein